MDKENIFLSVIIYLHNAEKNILNFMEMIHLFLNDNFDKFEIIFVDDASTDNSLNILKNAGIPKKMKGNVSIIHMSYYHGLELSMSAGLDLVIGDFVLEFDSLLFDFPTQLIMEVYRRALEGYDVVSAVPEQKVAFLPRVFYFIFNCTKIRKQYELQRERFRIVSRRAINRVGAATKYVPYRKVLYSNCGLPVDVIKYKSDIREEKHYDSQEISNRLNLAFNSLILFTHFVQWTTMALGLFFLIFALSIGCYTLGTYFSAHKPVEGWTMLMVFLSLSFSGVFLILTIINKYLALILSVVFVKQEYQISGVEKIS